MTMLAREVAAAIKAQGTQIRLRLITGKPPAPPNFSPGLVLQGALAAGATVLDLAADTADGTIIPGDLLVLPGQRVVVTNSVQAVANVWTGITFGGPILAAIAGGTPVTARWFNDKPAWATISYYAAEVIDGTLQVKRDMRIVVPAYKQVQPTFGQKVIVGNDVRTVIASDPVYYQGVVVKYTLRCR